VSLQCQHDGIIPAQKARDMLMDFRPRNNERPRTMCVRFRALIDEVQLQRKHSRCRLPEPEDLINSFMRALKQWHFAWQFANQFHSDRMRKWDQEGADHPALYEDEDSTKARWMQVLKELVDALSHWDNNNVDLNAKPPAVVSNAKECVSAQQRKKNGNRGRPATSGDKRPREDAPRGTSAAPASTRETFKISEEEYQRRKVQKLCFKCGSKEHSVNACPDAGKGEKDSQAALAAHSKAKQRSQSVQGRGA
jgi:hypothetical protein